MKIKTALLAAALASVFATAPALAGSWGTSGYTGLGYVDEGELKDNSFSSSFSFVYQFNDSLGAEFGYTRFGDFKDSFSTIEGNAKVEASIDGFHAGLNTYTEMSGDWYFTGRVGVWSWNADYKLKVPGTITLKASDDGVDLYAGAGIGYNFSPRFGAGLGATYYSAGVDGSNTGLYIVGLNTHYSF